MKSKKAQEIIDNTSDKIGSEKQNKNQWFRTQ